MKIFLVSLCIFLLLFAAVFINEQMVDRQIDKLLIRAKEIPLENSEGCPDAINAFADEWHKSSFFLSLTIPRSDLERISTEIPLLLLYAEDAQSEFLASRERLISLLQQIHDQQRFSLENVL